MQDERIDISPVVLTGFLGLIVGAFLEHQQVNRWLIAVCFGAGGAIALILQWLLQNGLRRQRIRQRQLELGVDDICLISAQGSSGGQRVVAATVDSDLIEAVQGDNSQLIYVVPLIGSTEELEDRIKSVNGGSML